MRKLGILVMAMVLVFGMSVMAMASSECGIESDNCEDSINVDVSVAEFCKISDLTDLDITIDDGSGDGSDFTPWTIQTNTTFDVTCESAGGSLVDISDYAEYEVTVDGHTWNPTFAPGESVNRTGEDAGEYTGTLSLAVDSGDDDWYDVDAGEFDDTVTLTVSAN